MIGIDTAALAALLSWASGIRLYATLFVCGLLGRFDFIELPAALQVLEHPYVLAASGILLTAEFLADKVPGFDSIWDAIHTFIRIPAGALLAGAAVSDAGTPTTIAAGLLGGTLTSGTHFAKSGTRALINTSPEPFTNWLASFGEEFSVGLGFVLLLVKPIILLVAILLFIFLLIWLLPKVLTPFFRLFRALRGGP